MCNNNTFLYSMIFQINPLKHLFMTDAPAEFYKEGPQP